MYRIEPDPAKLIRAVEAKHRGDERFIRAVAEGLEVLQTSPKKYRYRIIRLRDGGYRYRHGRCRIIYDIDEERKLVQVTKVAKRRESTYR